MIVSTTRSLPFALALLAAAPARAQVTLPEVRVIGVSPLPGLGVPKDQVPANVQQAGAREIEASQAQDLPSFLNRRLGSVYLNEVQGNPFQPDLNYRGFTASPMLGAQQGVSVYLDGVRLNQPFGDVVSWDLLPKAAIASATLMPGSNPLFGLNTLGGALAIESKDGRRYPGTSVQASFGSWGRVSTEFETGGSQQTGLHWYGLASGLQDQGWRAQSSSQLLQLFGKLGQRLDRGGELALTAAAASTRLVGTSLQEMQLLQQDYASVYTTPEENRSRALLLNLNWRQPFGNRLLSAQAWYRALRSNLLNGDANSDALGNAVANEPNGLLTRNDTHQQQAGAAAQWEWDARWWDRPTQLLLGAAAEASRTRFRQEVTPGALQPDRSVLASGAALDAVDLYGRTHSMSLFASSVVALAGQTHLTLAARYNRLRIVNRDALEPGGGPGSLDGDQVFARLNPALGLTHTFSPALGTYAGVSQGSRAPSSIELGCSDPAQPCKLPNAMAGDPPLRQVVATTLEAGLRGKSGAFSWNAGVFRAENRDDLLFVASDASGLGYFRNFGRTRRQGIELGADATLAPGTSFGFNYTLLDATFRSAELVEGAANSSNSGGTIAIRTGDRIPLVPRQLFKLFGEWRPSAGLSLGADLVAMGGSNARGNENGLHQADGVAFLGPGRSAGYAVVNLHAEAKPARGWKVFAQLQNLFDRRYASASQLGPTAFDAAGNYQPSPLRNSTFFAPGAPRAFWAGARYAFQ